jgi:hypothetical protein
LPATASRVSSAADMPDKLTCITEESPIARFSRFSSLVLRECAVEVPKQT